MSIRERRRGRALPTEEVPFPADQAAWDAAYLEQRQAEAAVNDSRRRGDPPPDAVERLDAANAAVEALEVDRFVVRTLSPDDWDLLVGEHPPGPDAEPDAQWNPATLFPALLQEAVTQLTEDGADSSTAAEWLEMRAAGEITPGQYNVLANTAVRLNTSATIVSDAVGKGSPATR